MVSFVENLKRKPNPLGFGFLAFGAGDRGRTCTNEHKILNLTRLPIPPHPHIFPRFDPKTETRNAI